MKPIIEVNHLTKEYQLGHITSLKENVFNTFRRLGGKPLRQRENVNALNDINFTIEQGEVVGIISHFVYTSRRYSNIDPGSIAPVCSTLPDTLWK